MVKNRTVLYYISFFIIIYLNCCTESNSEVSYEYDIQPIFEAHCTHCHDKSDPPANLCLTSYDSLMAGNSNNGPVVNPEQEPKYSILLQKVYYDNPPYGSRMPFDGPPYLNEQEVDYIWQWIYNGAKDN